METVTSKDGTTLAFDRLGQGPPVVLVCGGSVDRMADAAIAQELSSDFTVLNYDRRGRGDSGDTLPYAIEREVEDIEAVIDAAGGSAHLWGSSSGAVLAMIAAASGAQVDKLALWEPPFILDENARPPSDQVEQYERMIAEGRRGDAAEYFMTKVVGMPPEFVADARTQPWWAGQEAVAHTLAYDARIMGDYSIPTETAASVKVPDPRARRRGRHAVHARDRTGAGRRDPRRSGPVPRRSGAQRRPDGPGPGAEGVPLLVGLVASCPPREGARHRLRPWRSGSACAATGPTRRRSLRASDAALPCTGWAVRTRRRLGRNFPRPAPIRRTKSRARAVRPSRVLNARATRTRPSLDRSPRPSAGAGGSSLSPSRSRRSSPSC